MPLLLCFLISSLCILATAKQCINVIVPVDIQARQGIFNVPELWNNADATWFAQNFTSIGRNFTDDVLVGYRTVTGAYNNSARFCGPDSGIGANAILQFSTHGMVRQVLRPVF